MPEEMIMEKPKGSKTGMWILVLIIVAIVFGSAGYYVGKVRSKSKPETPVAQTATLSSATATVTTTATTDTTGWKTYTNEKYGFSFKYPATLSITDALSQSGNWSVSKKVIIQDTADSMEVWVNPDGFGPFFPDFSYDITASTSGLTVVSKTAGTSTEKSDGETLAISQFTYKTTEFLVHYRIKGSDSKPLTQFDQILSTFKFTK
ncbi:MAG: hypothetical protein ABH810_01535 [bacterium]